MWSEDYNAYVGKGKSSTEEFDIYGGGTYTLSGDQYTEFIKYCDIKHYIGKEVKMTLKLKKDTLFQTWHPIDTLGNQRTDVTLLEKYVRY